jgi:two-component system, LytTR family, response regulator
MLMTVTCIIVEDEPLAMERLQQYVRKLPFLQLQRCFDNGIDALVYLNSHPVQLLFLDINMAELNGIQLLQAKNSASEVIITTAYPDYALKSFELRVADYLLKPFSFDRFLQAVERVQTILAGQAAPVKDFVFVKTAHRLEKIMLDDVLYIEGMRDYRRIVMPDKKIMTLQTFKEFEELLPPSLICRVHKSYMVSLSKISAVEKEGVNINGLLLPVSDTYRKAFYQLIYPAQ